LIENAWREKLADKARLRVPVMAEFRVEIVC
jgi:hypothetical protein